LSLNARVNAEPGPVSLVCDLSGLIHT
jgi:hypothetical protein